MHEFISLFRARKAPDWPFLKGQLLECGRAIARRPRTSTDSLTIEVRRYVTKTKMKAKPIQRFGIKYDPQLDEIEVLWRQLPGFEDRTIREEINMELGRPLSAAESPTVHEDLTKETPTEFGYSVPAFLLPPPDFPLQVHRAPTHSTHRLPDEEKEEEAPTPPHRYGHRLTKFRSSGLKAG